MSDEAPRRRRSLPLALALVAVAVAVLVAGVVLLLVAGADDDPAASVQGGAVVRGAWASSGDGATAVYLTIENRGGDDRLVGAVSGAATSVQVMGGEVDMAGGEAGAPGSMHLDLPTGTTELGPGGRHLMLVGLDEPLEPGTTVPLRLDLEDAGALRTDVEVVTPEEAAARAARAG